MSALLRLGRKYLLWCYIHIIIPLISGLCRSSSWEQKAAFNLFLNAVSDRKNRHFHFILDIKGRIECCSRFIMTVVRTITFYWGIVLLFQIEDILTSECLWTEPSSSLPTYVCPVCLYDLIWMIQMLSQKHNNRADSTSTAYFMQQKRLGYSTDNEQLGCCELKSQRERNNLKVKWLEEREDFWAGFYFFVQGKPHDNVLRKDLVMQKHHYAMIGTTDV